MGTIGLDALRERAEGRARNGTVSLRAYDEGMALTLGASVWYSLTSQDPDDAPASKPQTGPSDRDGAMFPGYFVQVPGVQPPPGMPGVPMFWSAPEDVFSKHVYPCFEFVRGDLLPAMQRWHPGLLQFRAPADTAHPRTVGKLTGFDAYVENQQAVPFDISYSLYCECREMESARTVTNLMMAYALKVWPPYSFVGLYDSLNDVRTYDVFMEGVSPLDENNDVTRRMLGFSLSLRVEAELDLGDEDTKAAVASQPAASFGSL